MDKTNQKMSLTGQWQFLRQSHWELVKAENHWLIILVMDIPLMDKCHWPQSMTKIYGQNFKKNVIDHGQWQKNCHLLKVIYPLVLIFSCFHPTLLTEFISSACRGRIFSGWDISPEERSGSTWWDWPTDNFERFGFIFLQLLTLKQYTRRPTYQVQ